MKQIDLNGDWQLAESGPGAGTAQGWAYTGVPASAAIPARVPGDVHLDLMRAGRIEEPLFGKNALDCRWVEARDWWYSRTFHVDESFLEGADCVELHAAGLDLTAELWLNGQPVGHHNNQFIPATFNVTDIVHAGENLLVLRLDVGLRAAPSDRQRYVHISSLPASGLPRMWMRKAQFSFGWDWAPRLLTCGIWRPISLRAHAQAAIGDVAVVPHLTAEGAARVHVQAEVESFAPAAQDVHLHLVLEGDAAHVVDLDVTLLPGVNAVGAEIIVPRPRLWWPRPLGEPFLYDLSLEVSAAGRTFDRYETRVGIREIALRQEPLPDDEGTSFTIAVNGEPVFCQGANWAPADSILARVSADKYAALIGSAAEANFNMLRVWGGGIVEDPCFYQRCDEAGIMVWQDFLFACSLYPDDDPQFCSTVRQEAETIVRQLRNHPCLVLWCGNNENDWIVARRVAAGWNLPVFYGRKITHEILPEVCARLDPSRPYWPSSPYGGEDPNSDLAGDRHHWDVPINLKDPVERVDFRRWSAERGKFVSEFGMLAPPGEESLRRFLPSDEQVVGSPGWRFHNNLFEMDNLATSLRLTWAAPESLSLDEVVLATQINQAEALKMAFEHLRHRQFRTSGALFWAFNDCWGAIGWSVVDYTLARKPAFYHVRRALAPLLVSLHQHGDAVEIWLTNGTRQDRACSLEWGVLDLWGAPPDMVRTETASRANHAQQVATIPLSPAMQAEKGRYLPFARLLLNGEAVANNRCFLTGFAFKDLRLPPAEIAHSLQRVEGGKEATWLLRLEANAFAWAVRLQLPSSVWVEDNYFDLLPGEQREIALRGRPEDVAQLKVTSMNAFGPGRRSADEADTAD